MLMSFFESLNVTNYNLLWKLKITPQFFYNQLCLLQLSCHFMTEHKINVLVQFHTFYWKSNKPTHKTKQLYYQPESSRPERQRIFVSNLSKQAIFDERIMSFAPTSTPIFKVGHRFSRTAGQDACMEIRLMECSLL